MIHAIENVTNVTNFGDIAHRKLIVRRITF
jgi:hypothetical protein